jgi:AcrR family transcriptional regulator
MATQPRTGRANQKERTRTAIVGAARELITSGAEVTMSAVATRALVSEATAYRYFSDLPALLAEAITGTWPTAAEALAPMGHTDDPVERIGYATGVLLSGVHAYQGAVRAMIAAAVARPEVSRLRPGLRFGLIDEALAPWAATVAAADRELVEQLGRDLAVVVSAEAFFTLTDLCGLSPDAAIASAVHTARVLTAAAVREIPADAGAPRGRRSAGGEVGAAGR